MMDLIHQANKQRDKEQQIKSNPAINKQKKKNFPEK